MDKLLGFAPDADPTTPGVLLDCVNFIPTEKGMESGPTGATPYDAPVLGAACVGAAVVNRLNDTRRIIAGTQSALYELIAGAWVDVSRTVGGAYSVGQDDRWSITQFGDATLAANKNDVIQRMVGANFEDIAGAPKADVVFSVGGFAMALGVDDGTAKFDGWHCSAAFDDTDWTPSITTQSTSGRLVSAPGRLTAGGRLGEYAVAYKSRAIYLGQYVGAPVVWDWVQAPGGDAGCVGKNAFCDIGGAHFMVGEDDFYLFDGTRPVPVGNGVVSQWFNDNVSQLYRYMTTCVYDRQTSRVWVFYVSANSDRLDSALVYNLKSKTWGRADQEIECALNYVSSAVEIDELTGTMDTLPPVSFDSQFWLSGGRSLAVFDASHQMKSLTGQSAGGSITTWDAGDDDFFTLLTRVRLRFLPGGNPTGGASQSYTKNNLGDDLSSGSSSTLTGSRLDHLDCSRWHRVTVSLTGPCHVSAIEMTLVQEGTE